METLELEGEENNHEVSEAMNEDSLASTSSLNCKNEPSIWKPIEEKEKTNCNEKDTSNEVNRVRLEEDAVLNLTVSELLEKWKQQDLYIDYIENQLNAEIAAKNELIHLKESEEMNWKQQQLEATRRENFLVMRLSTKEHEMQDLVV